MKEMPITNSRNMGYGDVTIQLGVEEMP